MRRGTVRAECPAPTTPVEAAALDALAARIFATSTTSAPGVPDAGAVPTTPPTHDLDEFYLVASWFRRHPDELTRVERPAERPA